MALRVDEELRRKRIDAVQVEDVARQVGPDLVAQVVLVDVRLHVGRARLLDADPDDDEPLRLVRGRGLAQDGRLRLTRRTPAGPEVEPDGLALEVGEGDRLAV